MQQYMTDAMLGTLTRWLRILGYDVIYSRDYSDSQIIKIAIKSKRTIITKDRALYYKAKKLNLNVYFVESTEMPKILAELYSKKLIDLELNPEKSRCPECNGRLIKVTDKNLIRSRVPPGALKTYNVFYLCKRCGQVYWEGGHWKNIRRIINEARSYL
ncbi:MAG: Mut7-C RNAse domain-containing protein [Caldisphaera sp.]|jgi:Uncharacterized conserved protein|uniref:Mut7-C RNAse domain-containing protein n=1 Tax=Caldisphaera sp. TaxID=2060322 RepID=UPI00397B724B